MQHQVIKIPIWVCRYYLTKAMNPPRRRQDIGLQDGERTNTRYVSRRSNFTYLYLRTTGTRALDKLLGLYLSFKTGIDFRGGINARCAPINFYQEQDSIKVHRDRNMITGAPIDYIATIVLQQPTEGGEFFYNNGPQTVSADGKKVQYNSFFNRYFNLAQGEAIILRNNNSVHGVTPVIKGHRVTLTFRSQAPTFTPFAKIRRYLLATPRENFYLLTCRLIDRIEAAESFEELDEATREFHEAYKAYSTHEDFGDCYKTILEAIATKTNDLHEVNFS